MKGAPELGDATLTTSTRSGQGVPRTARLLKKARRGNPISGRCLRSSGGFSVCQPRASGQECPPRPIGPCCLIDPGRALELCKTGNQGDCWNQITDRMTNDAARKAAEEAGAEPELKPDSLEASTRYHHLDAVRAFALLLGVFFHAAESFGPNNHYWAIVDSSATNFLEAIRLACHSFRLELFFVIAGFFARLLHVRRGTGPFIKNRVQRILVPLVVGWMLLYPVLVLIWLWGASTTGRLQYFGVPPEALNWPVWGLTFGFFITGGFVQRFDLTHLWFLHQLVVLYALMLGINWVAGRWDRFGERWRESMLGLRVF